MTIHGWTRTGLTRLTAVAVLVTAGALSASTYPAQAATTNLIWTQNGPISGYGVSTECNPGNTTSLPCGPSDVAISTDPTGQFTEVTANPQAHTTFVNAVGGVKFTDTTPDGQPIQLKTYRYVLAFRLPGYPP